MTFIQKINPINKEEEKEKFLFDPLYNPQFRYAEDINDQERANYSHLDTKYLELAKKILEKGLKKYGSEENLIKEIEGEILSLEEVERKISHYLQENHLENVSISYSSSYVARTSMNQDEIRLRLPLEYGEKTFQGVLDHEIGTHYFRRLNDRLRPWHKKRHKFQLRPYLETEEGLAIIHQYLDVEDPLLWRTAMYYYAVWLGNQMSFSELNKELMKYIQTPERRWKMCLRVKRGIKDTFVTGALFRDQLYLLGVMKLIDWLERNEYDFKKLYIGKICVEDIQKVEYVLTDSEVLLSKFLQNMSQNEYRKKIERIKKCNFEK